MPGTVFFWMMQQGLKADLNTLMYPEAISPHIICWKKRIINVYWINATTFSRQSITI